MKRKIFKILVAIVLLFLILIISRNFVVKTLVKLSVRHATEMRVSIDNLDIGIFSSNIKIEGMTIYNPRGFDEKILADIPLIYVDYNFSDLFKKILHITQLEININEVNIVKNKNKEINLNKIKSVKEDNIKEEKKLKKDKKLNLQVDEMLLSIDHVRFIDYSSGDTPKDKRILLGLKQERFKNLNSVNEIVREVAFRTIVKAGLNNITNEFKKIGSTFKSGFEKVKNIFKSDNSDSLKKNAE